MPPPPPPSPCPMLNNVQAMRHARLATPPPPPVARCSLGLAARRGSSGRGAPPSGERRLAAMVAALAVAPAMTVPVGWRASAAGGSGNWEYLVLGFLEHSRKRLPVHTVTLPWSAQTSESGRHQSLMTGHLMAGPGVSACSRCPSPWPGNTSCTCPAHAAPSIPGPSRPRTSGDPWRHETGRVSGEGA